MRTTLHTTRFAFSLASTHLVGEGKALSPQAGLLTFSTNINAFHTHSNWQNDFENGEEVVDGQVVREGRTKSAPLHPTRKGAGFPQVSPVASNKERCRLPPSDLTKLNQTATDAARPRPPVARGRGHSRPDETRNIMRACQYSWGIAGVVVFALLIMASYYPYLLAQNDVMHKADLNRLEKELAAARNSEYSPPSQGYTEYRGPTLAPGTLDIVVTFYNESRKSAYPVREDGRCGQKLGAGCPTSTPCCDGWLADDGGQCSAGGGAASVHAVQPTCQCPECLDFRVALLSDEVRWLLRGVHTHYGVYSNDNPEGLVGKIYIIYNTLAPGNGPPMFVDWKEDTDPVRRPPPGCKDKTYTAGKYGELVAVPHCALFPKAGVPPGRSRAASQIIIHRIPGLQEWFMYMEDDMAPTTPFVQSQFFDERGRIKTHMNYINEVIPKGDWRSNQVLTIPMACHPCLLRSTHHAVCTGNDRLALIKLCMGLVVPVSVQVLVPHARASITPSMALSSKKG